MKKIIRYVKLFIFELIYTIITVVYLFNLNSLNKVLLSNQLNYSVIEQLLYNDGLVITYFIIFIILFLLGLFIIMRNVKNIRGTDLNFDEIITYLIAIIVVSILLVLLFVFINNPILRIITLGLALTYGSVTTMTN